MLKAVALAGATGLLGYGLAGAVVAALVNRASRADDPEHPLDAHALLSIVMCWPHDVQSLRRSSGDESMPGGRSPADDPALPT